MADERDPEANPDLPPSSPEGPVPYRQPSDRPQPGAAPGSSPLPSNGNPRIGPIDQTEYEQITREAVQYTLDTDETASRLMSYRGHLEELRDRLIKAVIALCITTLISFLFTNA